MKIKRNDRVKVTRPFRHDSMFARSTGTVVRIFDHNWVEVNLDSVSDGPVPFLARELDIL